MPDEHTTTLSCEHLTVRVPGRLLVEKLSLELKSGQFLAILGRNGAGKSLTLHTLAGLRPADGGDVRLFGRSLAAIARKEVARQLALLPQHDEDAFPATVFDTALCGRHPHVPQLHWETAADRAIAGRALESMDIGMLRNRDVATLSGGERRRLAVAQVLTQAPQVYLLDEPTNHLDPQHQLDVLRRFTKEAESGSTVVASLHDVNLAARYADQCLLLYGDGRWTLGAAAEVLCAERLSELYATSMEAVPWRKSHLFVATGTANAP